METLVGISLAAVFSVGEANLKHHESMFERRMCIVPGIS